MRCGSCGKEFQTYNGICPYCHARAGSSRGPPSVAPAQPVPPAAPAPSAPPTQPAPIVVVRPTQPVERPGPADSHRPSRRPSSDRGLKIALTSGFVLLIVLVVWTALASSPGLLPVTLTIGATPSPTATDIPVPTLPATTTRATMATAAPTRTAGTLSPYSVDPDSITPNPYATRYVAPGYRQTLGAPAPAATPPESGAGSIMVLVTPYPLVIDSTQIRVEAPPTISTPTTIKTDPITVIPIPPALEVSVNSMQFIGPLNPYLPPQSGYQYIQVDFTLRNNEYPNGYYYNPFNAKLIDEKGYQYGYSAASYSLPDVFSGVTLSLGQTRSGKLIFEVPANHNENNRYSLKIQGNY